MLISFLRGETLRPYYTESTGATATGTAQAAATEPPAPTDPAETDDFDKDRAMETIRKLRAVEKEAKAKEKRLAELEAAAKEREQADLTQTQKLEKELATIKAQQADAAARLRRATLKDAAREAAEKAGLSFAVGALADAVQLGAFDDLEIADDGSVTGMGTAIKTLQTKRPYLFGTTQAASPRGTPAGPRGAGSATPPAASADAELIAEKRRRIGAL